MSGLDLLIDLIIKLTTLLTTLFIWFQARQIAIQTRASVYQQISQQMLNIDKIFLKNPGLRKFFYDKSYKVNSKKEAFEKWMAIDEVTKQRLLAIAELLVDFLDNILYQRKYLKGYPWETWDVYFCELFKSVPVIVFLEEQRGGRWYPDSIKIFARKCITRKCIRIS